jgi:hypothetical protein
MGFGFALVIIALAFPSVFYNAIILYVGVFAGVMLHIVMFDYLKLKESVKS